MTDVRDSGRVLIADDEPTFREATAALLRKAGYECLTAADGLAAVDLARRGVDVMIADIRMAGNTDLELIADARLLSPPPPVILVTGYPALHTAVRAIGLQVMGYLIKPVPFPELLEHVRQAMLVARTQQSLQGIRNHLRVWAEQTGALQDSMAGPMGDPELAAILTVAAAAEHLAALLIDLRNLTRLTLRGRSGEREGQLLQALEEAVDVLERTKNSFKSRELADLRRKLEQVLAGP